MICIEFHCMKLPHEWSAYRVVRLISCSLIVVRFVTASPKRLFVYIDKISEEPVIIRCVQRKCFLFSECEFSCNTGCLLPKPIQERNLLKQTFPRHELINKTN